MIGIVGQQEELFASLALDHTSSPYSTWSKIFSFTLAMIVKKVVVNPCVKLICERYVSIYIYGNIQIENAPPVQLPKLKSNYRMNEWQFQNLSSMFKRHSSIFSDASWKLDCGFKGRERYTIWQSLELAQIPGTFCLSKLEPPCEQTYWGGSIFFQLSVVYYMSGKPKALWLVLWGP